jgi:hypothetical protein
MGRVGTVPAAGAVGVESRLVKLQAIREMASIASATEKVIFLFIPYTFP